MTTHNYDIYHADNQQFYDHSYDKKIFNDTMSL